MTVEFDTQPPSGPGPGPARRRRVVAVVGAAMLVAAAGGVGFGIGRSIERDDAVSSPAAQPADNDVADDAAIGAPPATEAAAPPAVDRPATTDVFGSEPVAGGDHAIEGDVVASGGGGWTVFGDTTAQLLFERTTDTGITLRAHLGQLWENEPYYEEPGGWQPPGWCYESGQVRLAMNGAGVIDIGSVAWYSEPYKGRAVSWVTMGRVDGSPHRVVFVQTPADTQLVTATFGDGSSDSVAPQNGVALLVVAGEPATIVHDEGDYSWSEEMPDFEVTFDGGTEAVTVDETGAGIWNDPELADSCSPPPPALPEAGEQPDDAAAAEAEIVELMATLYTEGGLLANLDRVDDPTGVEDAANQVGEGSFQAEASSAEAIVEELVFTAADTAWFRYRIETSGIDLDNRYGVAVFVDGVWKITRDTICQDLGMAGGSCGADTTFVRPPGYDFGAPEFGVEEGDYIVD